MNDVKILAALILAVFVLLVCAEAAEGGIQVVSWRNSDPWVAKSVKAANESTRYPCGGRTVVRWSWRYPANTNLMWAWPDECIVEMNANELFDSVALCQYMIHEFWHLRGRGHSTNANSVMYEGNDGWVYQDDGLRWIMPRSQAHPRCRGI